MHGSFQSNAFMLFHVAASRPISSETEGSRFTVQRPDMRSAGDIALGYHCIASVAKLNMNKVNISLFGNVLIIVASCFLRCTLSLLPMRLSA